MAPNRVEVRHQRPTIGGSTYLRGHALLHRVEITNRDELRRIEELTQGGDSLRPLVHVGAEELPDPLESGHPADPAFVRGDERQTLQSMLRGERELLRDHAAHGHADHVALVPAELVHHAQGVVRHGLHGPGARGPVALPDASVVQPGQAVLPLEPIDLRTPDVSAHAETHQEQDARTLGSCGPVGDMRGGLGAGARRHVHPRSCADGRRGSNALGRTCTVGLKARAAGVRIRAMTPEDRTRFVQIVGQVLIADGILGDSEREHLDRVMDELGLEGDARKDALKGIDVDSPVEDRVEALGPEARAQLLAAVEKAAALEPHESGRESVLLIRLRELCG